MKNKNNSKTHFNEYREFNIKTDWDRHFSENQRYPSNFIRTSLYTIYDFLPISLLK